MIRCQFERHFKRKLCSKQNAFKWCYRNEDYRQTNRKANVMTMPLSVWKHKSSLLESTEFHIAIAIAANTDTGEGEYCLCHCVIMTTSSFFYYPVPWRLLLSGMLRHRIRQNGTNVSKKYSVSIPK